jgi:hypothetical protein
MNDMSEIISLICLKKYDKVLEKLCNLNNQNYNQENFNKVEYFYNNNTKKIIFNLLSKFVFIVSDLNDLLNNLKNLGFDEINAGPQKFRGYPSYIGFINSSLDKDFRNSMYRHDQLFSNKHEIKSIPLCNFGFKNIHINLGNVR